MNKNNLLKTIILPIIAGSVLIGCGGGGGGSSSSISSVTSGIVSGSFYEGAKVCLDVNSNGKCDAGETFTTSDANGAFSLSGGDYDVVAEIPVNAIKHAISGDVGTTVTTAITFLAPKDAKASDGKHIVSAISTKVWSAMKENNETLEQAKTSVAGSISGVDAADLLQNFNDTSKLSQIKRNALQSKADAETTNIESSMSNGTVNLTTLRTKMTEDVVSRATANLTVNGLTTPSQVDALDASN